jgi:hypothetical protein
MEITRPPKSMTRPFQGLYDAKLHRAHRRVVYLWAAFCMQVVMFLCVLSPQMSMVFTIGDPSLGFYIVGYLFSLALFLTALWLTNEASPQAIDKLCPFMGFAFLVEPMIIMVALVNWGGVS